MDAQFFFFFTMFICGFPSTTFAGSRENLITTPVEPVPTLSIEEDPVFAFLLSRANERAERRFKSAISLGNKLISDKIRLKKIFYNRINSRCLISISRAI